MSLYFLNHRRVIHLLYAYILCFSLIFTPLFLQCTFKIFDKPLTLGTGWEKYTRVKHFEYLFSHRYWRSHRSFKSKRSVLNDLLDTFNIKDIVT